MRAAGAGSGAVTWRWRLLLRSRAWNELGVSMVCCRERPACGALTELCLNHGRDILRRLLCCLRAGGGGGVPIAPARPGPLCRRRARAGRCVAAASARARGALATAARRPHRPRAPPAPAHYAASVSSYGRQFILLRGREPQSRANDHP